MYSVQIALGLARVAKRLIEHASDQIEALCIPLWGLMDELADPLKSLLVILELDEAEHYVEEGLVHVERAETHVAEVGLAARVGDRVRVVSLVFQLLLAPD